MPFYFFFKLLLSLISIKFRRFLFRLRNSYVLLKLGERQESRRCELLEAVWQSRERSLPPVSPQSQFSYPLPFKTFHPKNRIDRSHQHHNHHQQQKVVLKPKFCCRQAYILKPRGLSKGAFFGTILLLRMREQIEQLKFPEKSRLKTGYSWRK